MRAAVRDDRRSRNVPLSRTSVAAARIPAIAARHSEVARLTRRTPAASSVARSHDLPFMPTMKLTGLVTAAHTARTASRSGSAGANSTSAPAASYAFRRAIVSARSG